MMLSAQNDGLKGARDGWVLLVEDQAPVRRMIARVLAGLGYGVLEAECGASALALARATERSLRLVLADLVLPDIDGREVYARVRVLHPEARALFMSGYSDESAVGPGLLRPGIGFIGKPFTVQELAAKIEDVLSAALSPGPPSGRA